MDIFELIWIFIVVYFLYRLFFAPSKPRQEHDYDVPSEPHYEEEESSTKTRDDILDEMRTIFGEESTTKKPPQQSPQKTREQRPHRPQPRQPAEETGESRFSSYTGTDFLDTRGQRSDADKALEDVTLESRALQEERLGKKNMFKFLFDQNEIRKGIIVSEVLGKPKSRKRHNI